MKGLKYDALVQSLSQGARVQQLRGVPVELRSCADRREGEVDPRTAAAFLRASSPRWKTSVGCWPS